MNTITEGERDTFLTSTPEAKSTNIFLVDSNENGRSDSDSICEGTNVARSKDGGQLLATSSKTRRKRLLQVAKT